MASTAEARHFGAGNKGGKKRAVSSKYDVHKVKVWLGDNNDHYYILSRFLISRSLTITKIPSTKAVKIALELKKYLVDRDKTSVSQAELEEILFGLMRAKGFGQAYIDCYRTVSAFYTMRQPLVIILCGAPCTGKSTMAQQLAARLNMPNVMQTDVICELLRRATSGALPPQPPWSRTLSPEQLQQVLLGSGEVDMAHASDGGSVLASAPGSGVVLTPSGSQARAVAGGGSAGAEAGAGAGAGAETGAGAGAGAGVGAPELEWRRATRGSLSGPLGSEGTEATSCGQYGGDGCTAANGAVDAWLLSQFREECRVVRRALEGDFNKALSDGKPLIVEGVHLDPEQLLGELQERGIVLLPFEPQPATPSGLATPGGAAAGARSPPPFTAGRTGTPLSRAWPRESRDAQPSGQQELVPEQEQEQEPGPTSQGGVPASTPLQQTDSGGVIAASSPGAVRGAGVWASPQAALHLSRVSRCGSNVSVGSAASGASAGGLHTNPTSRVGGAGIRAYQKHVSWGRLHAHGVGEVQDEGQELEQKQEAAPSAAAGLRPASGSSGDLVGGSSSIAEQGPFLDALPRGVDGASPVALPGSQQLGVEAVAEPSPAGTSSLLAGGDCVDGSSGKLFAPHGQQASPERHGRHGGVAAGLVAMGRAAASSHGGSSTRTSLAGGHGGDGDEARDDESDVNNYGDADTEGGSGSVSPVRGVPGLGLPHALASMAEGSVGVGAGPGAVAARMRRVVSHPVMPQLLGSGERASSGREGEGGAEGADGEGVVDAVDALEPSAGGRRPGGKSAIASVAFGGVEGSTGATAATATDGMPGGGGAGPSGRPFLDRARSHHGFGGAGGNGAGGSGNASARLTGGSAGGVGGGAQACGGIFRCGSLAGRLSALDLSVVRNSLAGILRVGSAVYGRRHTPSPGMPRRRTALAGDSAVGDRLGASTPGGDGGGGHSASPTHMRATSPRLTSFSPERGVGPGSARAATGGGGGGGNGGVRVGVGRVRRSSPGMISVGDMTAAEGLADAATPAAAGLTPGMPPAARSDGVDSLVPLPSPGESGYRLEGQAEDARVPSVAAAVGASSSMERGAAAAPGTTPGDEVVEKYAAGEEAEEASRRTTVDAAEGGSEAPLPATPLPAPRSAAEAASGAPVALPPLFVPVVLCMSEADHRLALEDNLAVHVKDAAGGLAAAAARAAAAVAAVGTGAAAGGSDCAPKPAGTAGGGSGAGLLGGDAEAPNAEEVLRRAQAIQSYLCGYEAQGLPVINVRYGNFGEALDILHEYVLMCIQAAMEQLNGGEGDPDAAGVAAGAAII